MSLSPAARRPRTAIGITPGRKLLLMAVQAPISLWRLAKLMRSLGAYHAVAMDGGSSTGLYFQGQMAVRPARALTNVLVIYADEQRYEQARSTFLGRSHPRSVARPPSLTAPAILVTLEPAADGRNPEAGSVPNQEASPSTAAASANAVEAPTPATRAAPSAMP